MKIVCAVGRQVVKGREPSQKDKERRAQTARGWKVCEGKER